MRRRLERIFDVERYRSGWDVRLWPSRWRIAYMTKPTDRGVQKRVELYRIGVGNFAYESWRRP